MAEGPRGGAARRASIAPARNLGSEVVRAFRAWLTAARILRGANVSGLAPVRNGGNAA
ncbi:transcription regulator (fragment) [Ralstonia solanacearum CMR15]